MARVLNKDARRRKEQSRGGWKELGRRAVRVSWLSPWTLQKSGSACSSAAGLGWGKVRSLPPERALECAVCIGWATAQTLELGDSKERDPDSPSSRRLCQGLVCWAVIPEGHGTQAGAWERDVSAQPHVACLFSPYLSLPVTKPPPLLTYLPTAHLPAPLSSCPPQSILLEVKGADPCRIPAGGWALVMG